MENALVTNATCFRVPRYAHVEAEYAFISFDDLLNKIEDLICDVVQKVFDSPYKQLILELNPVSTFDLI